MVWLNWLDIVLQTKRLPVQSPVPTHAWAAGLVPSHYMYGRLPIDVSLSHRCFSPSISPSLPISLKVKKF